MLAVLISRTEGDYLCLRARTNRVGLPYSESWLVLMPNGIMPTCIMRFLDREEAARLIALSKRRDGGLAVVTGRLRVGEDAALVEWVDRSGGVSFVADQSSTESRGGLELVDRSYRGAAHRHHSVTTGPQPARRARCRRAYENGTSARQRAARSSASSLSATGRASTS